MYLSISNRDWHYSDSPYWSGKVSLTKILKFFIKNCLREYLFNLKAAGIDLDMMNRSPIITLNYNNTIRSKYNCIYNYVL